MPHTLPPREDADHFAGMRFGTVIRRLDAADTMFAVVRHVPENHRADRPLVVVIHPGDMIEDPAHWDDATLGQAVAMFSAHNLAGTGRELADWRSRGADFAVLHRSSCEQFPEHAARGRRCGRKPCPTWTEIRKGHRHGTQLFGDDLRQAADWMIANLHVRARPHLFMAGAYSGPTDGCLTYVAKAFEQATGPERITVSEYSPPTNCPDKVWRPGGACIDMTIDEATAPGLRQALAAARQKCDRTPQPRRDVETAPLEA